MPRFKTIKDIENGLIPFTNRVASTIGRGGITLDRTMELAAAVGNPHEKLKVVHVAGTSGKTTTSYYVAEALRLAGNKVGLTVSPHIVSIKERALIDNKELSDETYIDYFNQFFDLTSNAGLEPTYFELMMVFAYWVFAKEAVDYAVIETGFGGLYDSSNLARREDKVCIITDIGFDHTAILGNTLSEIASQKAGIIADHNILVMYEQSQEVMMSVGQTVDKHKADLLFAPKGSDANYFERNMNLALYAYQQIANRDKLTELNIKQIKSLSRVRVPGRLETIRVGGCQILLDGAHNEQKMSTLVKTLLSTYPNKSWKVILAMKADKDTARVIEKLKPIAEEVAATVFRSGQDLPTSAAPVKLLKERLIENNIAVNGFDDLESALKYYLDKGAGQVLVTGSFYAVAEARAWLVNQMHGIVEA